MNNDNVKLLRECDAGIKMGVKSIEDVLDHVSSPELKEILDDNKREHDALKTDCNKMLSSIGEDGKDPNPIAESMSWLKTNFKLTKDKSDETISDLMTDGCNMGIKSLSRYLNQYKNADKESKDLAKKLINLEEDLVYQLRSYL